MKKLLVFLMVTIPLIIVLIVNITIDIVVGDIYVAVERISLDQTSVVANVDDKIMLHTKVYPENATNPGIIWSSDNEEVAVVDENGVVSFNSFGKAYITATSQNGYKRATCYFYVTDSKVHQVILSAPSKVVPVGQSMQLNATILPNEALNKAVVYKTSDEKIATVDSNGLVYGLKVGTVDITVQADDGGYTDMVSLTIVNPVSGIVVDEKNIVTNQSFYQIGYTIYPLNATNQQVSFEIDNKDVASVDNYGVLTFHKAGIVNVKVITIDGKFEDNITVEYLDGYAKDLIIDNHSINTAIGNEPIFINYRVVPSQHFNAQIQFSSLNNDVATVDSNGCLQAVGGGSTIITLKIETKPNEYIERQVFVYVESPAQEVVIENITTASPNIQLAPKSLPTSSTNTSYFYHSENDLKATVDENGMVNFVSQTACDVNITIYANEDLSDIYKTIKITYTAGKAADFEIVNKDITIDYGLSTSLDYKIFPVDTIYKNFNISVESNETMASGEVVEILPDGSIVGIAGGKSKLKVSLVLYDGTVKEEICNIFVKRQPTDIEVKIDLETFENQYVTAENSVILDAQVLPVDSTNQDIYWSIADKNIGVIVGNTLKFNQLGVAVLTAKAGDFEKKVEIRYTGSYPISAEVCVEQNGVKKPMPQVWDEGECFNIVLESIFPSDTINKNISIQLTNQRTLHPSGDVLLVEGNKVTAMHGGQATLIVNVSTTVQIHFDIQVNKMATELVVSPKDIKTSNQTLSLHTEVLPVDTTDKTVRYIVKNENIATIENDKLIFKQNGICKIKVVSNSNPDLFVDFIIEKIEKDATIVSPQQKDVDVLVGDFIYFDISSYQNQYDKQTISLVRESPILENMNVIDIVQNKILVKNVGEAVVKLELQDSQTLEILSFELNIHVIQLVEKIKFQGEIDSYQGEFIVASDKIDLNLKVLPEYATNKLYDIKIIESYSTNGVSESIAYLAQNKINFTKAGNISVEVRSKDNNFVGVYKVKYTGGNAVDCELNYSSPIIIEAGDKISIEAVKWVPKDTLNKMILIKEIWHTNGVEVIQINNKTNQITAINGGVSKLLVEISNGLTRELEIQVLKKVTAIKVDYEEILTAKENIVINAEALPSIATNKTLTYTLKETDIAYIMDNQVFFNKPGTVVVNIATTDGSNITKDITITSTMGYLNEIVLNKTQKELAKNSHFSLYVVQSYPLDAIHKDITFEILSMNASDGSDNPVISLGEDGLIEALYGGTSVVRVSSIGFGGTKIYTDCEINVSCVVNSIDITLKENLDIYQNSFVTSQNEIEFEKHIYPNDATNREFDIVISDNNIAEVVENKIKFKKQGKVSIKFTSKDKSFGEKSKILTFYYTTFDLLTADIERTNIDNNIINLKVGEKFSFNPVDVVPSDMKNFKFSYNNMVVNKNDSSLSVLSLDKDVFTALHGGNVSFDLKINNISLGKFTIIVNQFATGIEIENTSIFVSEPNYQIDAKVVPSDTHQQKLIFTSRNDTIASVSQKGEVEFKKFGVVEIVVSVEGNSEIAQVITIEYTKQLREILFNETKNQMYVGEYVDLMAFPNPSDAENFAYEMTATGEGASLIKRNGSYRLVCDKPGTVTVIAKAVGSDIFTMKQFTFFSKILDIQLALDNINDVNGQGQYRYFGNHFISSKNEIHNNYKMQYSLKPQSAVDAKLTWNSSNEDIATIIGDGVVSFKGVGPVRITVTQTPPYPNAKVVSDYYDFNVVNGVNASTFNEYLLAGAFATEQNKEKTKDYMAVVLQNNIVACDNELFDPGSIVLNYNLLGNGYMFDLSVSRGSNQLNIQRDNVIIDNIHLRGCEFDTNASLSNLRNAGNLLTISNNTKGALVYNCVLENTSIGIDVRGSDATIKGCIFRNTYIAGISLSRELDAKIYPNVTVKDSIFSNSLLCGIILGYDQSKTQMGKATLTLEGDVRFYNWLTLDEMERGFMAHLEEFLSGFGLAMKVIEDGARQIKEIMSKYNDYKYVYNGKEYFHFGIMKFQASLAGQDFHSLATSIDRTKLSANCNYVDLEINGMLHLAQGITNASFTVNLLTLTSSQPFIRPMDKYEDDQYLLQAIRQPKLF